MTTTTLDRLTDQDLDEILGGLDSEARMWRLCGPAIIRGQIIADESGLYQAGPLSIGITGCDDPRRGLTRAAYILY